jgi:hypothetical protein
VVSKIATFLRDIVVLLGMPALVVVGIQLYDLQIKSLEAQHKAIESQVKAVEAQNGLLKETQYDRALAIIRAQKDVFVIEREELERRAKTKERQSLALQDTLNDITDTEIKQEKDFSLRMMEELTKWFDEQLIVQHYCQGSNICSFYALDSFSWHKAQGYIAARPPQDKSWTKK